MLWCTDLQLPTFWGELELLLTKQRTDYRVPLAVQAFLQSILSPSKITAPWFRVSVLHISEVHRSSPVKPFKNFLRIQPLIFSCLVVFSVWVLLVRFMSHMFQVAKADRLWIQQVHPSRPGRVANGWRIHPHLQDWEVKRCSWEQVCWDWLFHPSH